MIRIATITNFIGRQGHSPSDMGRGAEVALRAVCKAISENDQAALKNMLTPALYSVYQPPLERLNRENGRVVLELGSVDLGQIVESDTFVAPSDAMKRYWYEYLIRWGYRRPVSEDDLARMRETYLTKLANKTKEIRDQDTRNHTVTLVPSETGVTYAPFNPSSAKKSLLSAEAMKSILEQAKQLERIIQVDVLLDADIRFEVQLPTGATGIADCDEPVESQLHRFVIVTLQATCSTSHNQSPLDWRVADIDYTVDHQIVMNRLTHPDVIPLAESYPARQPS
ncbi:hypothetical protein IWQ60_000293 [Tieghemiomyces parasiticus]|uniref:Uncharacterized protein n=1 Tax=Tieghemiomyces parasiticus TaxID=78921 RepID=A0A9W8AGC9_9FUNG|nr:hypothetical protein IWQ60_000293 [Tieghemiomyces parasiticus]